MIYGYARCSTNESKQDITRQIRELKIMGATDETIYLEYESGINFGRVELTKLLNVVVANDTIVSTEVSRITRSIKDLCDIIELVKSKKVKLVLDTFVLDCTKDIDVMTEGMLKMMGVFAEMERNIIRSRIKSGITNARAKGVTLGRRETEIDTIPTVFKKYCTQYLNKDITITELANLCKISRPTVYKYIKIMKQNF